MKDPEAIDVQSTGWKVDMAQAVDLDSAYYGHARVLSGRFSLDDQALMERARALLPRARAVASLAS